MFNVNEKKILYQLVANENIVKTIQRIQMSAQGLNNDLSRVSRNFQNNFNNINSMITKTTNNFEKMRRTMMRISSIVFLPLAFMGSREYLRSEKATAMYNTIQDFNMSPAQKKLLYSNANEISRITGQSQSQVIELFTELEKGGLNSGALSTTGIKNSMGVIVSKIKAITGQTSEEVGNMVISLISSFGLKNLPKEEMEKRLLEITSKYIKSANISKFNYADIRALNKKSIAVMLNSGLNENQAMALQSVAGNSFDPSQVDRGLSSSMQRLSNLPAMAQNFLKRYAGLNVEKLKKSGLSIGDIFFKILEHMKTVNSLDISKFDPKNENYKNLMRFSEKSASQLQAYSPDEFNKLKQNFLTKEISVTFGKDFAPLILTLSNNLKQVNENMEIIKNTNPNLLEESFQKTLPPLATSFNKMGVSFNNLFNNLMKNGLEEKIIKIIESLTNFMDKLAKNDGLLKVMGEMVVILTELILAFAAFNIVLKTTAGIMAIAGFVGKAGKASNKVFDVLKKGVGFGLKSPLKTTGYGLLASVLAGLGYYALDEFGGVDWLKSKFNEINKFFNGDKSDEKQTTPLNINVSGNVKVEAENNDNYDTNIKYEGVQTAN